MNLDKWNSLSPENQKAIEAINEKYFTEVAMGLWDKQNEAAMKWAVEDQGVQEIKLTDEEAERWINLVQPIQDEFVANLDAKGLEGRQVMDTVLELADKYNKEYQ